MWRWRRSWDLWVLGPLCQAGRTRREAPWWVWPDNHSARVSALLDGNWVKQYKTFYDMTLDVWCQTAKIALSRKTYLSYLQFDVANTQGSICQFHGYDPRVSDFVSFLAAAVWFSVGFHNIGGTGIISTGGEGGEGRPERSDSPSVNKSVNTSPQDILVSKYGIRVLGKFKGLLRVWQQFHCFRSLPFKFSMTSSSWLSGVFQNKMLTLQWDLSTSRMSLF